MRRATFDGRQVVPTRFVRACPRGHISDLDWHWFVHGPEDACRRQLWLDERGTGGDLADLVVRCECGKSRRMAEAAELDMKPLGSCWGARPWLGADSQEQCGLPSRLLIRTAANAYFPQVMSALSLPEHGTQLEEAVATLWDDLQIVEDSAELAFMRKKPKVATKLAGHSDEEILDAIARLKHGESDEQPVKLVELDALLAAPAGYGDDVPIDPDFHARRLPESAWRVGSLTDPVAAVVQLHRLREVLALIGFTRFDAITPDIHGEYDSDVQRAELALDPQWFPAIENRGEGIFMQLDSGAVAAWLARRAVVDRLGALDAGHAKWTDRRQRPAAVSRRPLRAVAHALAPARAVDRDAVRLPGQLHPRADLRRWRERPLRTVALHRQLRR